MPDFWNKAWIPAFAGMTMLISSVSAAPALTWHVLPEKSSITFTAHYGEQSVTGQFPNYTANIQFDPDHPQQGKIVVRIEMTKVQSSDKDAQQSLPGNEWFAVGQYPVATFESQSIAAATNAADGKRRYEAKGMLTIRDKTVPVVLLFTLELRKGTGADVGKTFAHAEGSLTLKRLDFGVGHGVWADTGTVKNEVVVQVKLEAVAP